MLVDTDRKDQRLPLQPERTCPSDRARMLGSPMSVFGKFKYNDLQGIKTEGEMMLMLAALNLVECSGGRPSNGKVKMATRVSWPRADEKVIPPTCS
jgi:hypothetical protein